jgi:hypothetical protein
MEFKCEFCFFSTIDNEEYQHHLLTKRHRTITEGHEFIIYNGKMTDLTYVFLENDIRSMGGSYICDCCNITLSNKQRVMVHTNTQKHKKAMKKG